MSTIEVALDGKARLWFNLNNNFQTYDQFRLAFIRDFYSVPVQGQCKARWSNIRYKEQDGNFVTFCYKQIKFASYIIPKLSEYERNYVIVQQFPYWVKEALASVDLQNSNNITSTLTKLDLIQAEKKAYRQQHQQMTSQPLTQAPQTVRVRHMSVGRGRGRGYNNHQYYLPFEPKLRFGNISQTFPNTQPSYADAQQIIMPDVRVPPPTHTPILSNNNTIAYDSMTNTESRNLNSM